MRSRHSRLPRPLLALLFAAGLLQVAWALAVPALQQPDESSHFSYVQIVAERHEIPWPGAQGPRGDLERFSEEQRVASIAGGLQPLLANPAARPLWTEADEDLWAQRDRALSDEDRRDIEDSSAFANPPAYYLYAAAVYEIAGGSFFDRTFVLRLANLPWILLLVAATWWLACQLLGCTAAAVLATGVVALQPLATSIAGGVGPDAMLSALAALVLALAVDVARRGVNVRRVAVLVAVTALTALTHGRGLGLALPAAVGLLLGLRRSGVPPRIWRVLLAGATVVSVGGALAVVAYAQGGALSANGTRGFASYLWQFYLPALPGMEDPPFVGWTVRDVFVDRFYGTFGQLEIVLSAWVRDVIAAAGWLLLAGVAAVVASRRNAVARRGPALIVLGAGVVGVLGLVHAQAYRGLLDVPGDPVITGRYLLLLLPVFGVAIAAVMRALPGRAFAVAGGGTLGAAILLQAAALGATLVRFYA